MHQKSTIPATDSTTVRVVMRATRVVLWGRQPFSFLSGGVLGSGYRKLQYLRRQLTSSRLLYTVPSSVTKTAAASARGPPCATTIHVSYLEAKKFERCMLHNHANNSSIGCERWLLRLTNPVSAASVATRWTLSTAWLLRPNDCTLKPRFCRQAQRGVRCMCMLQHGGVRTKAAR
jgi:hypothetical protein